MMDVFCVGVERFVVLESKLISLAFCSADRLPSAERRVNFEGVHEPAAGAGDIAPARSGGRLMSANKLSSRFASSGMQSDALSTDILQQQQQQQQPTASLVPRTLVLYSKPTESLPISDELQPGELVSSPLLPDGARLLPFSVNSLRWMKISPLLSFRCRHASRDPICFSLSPPATCSPVNVVRNLSADIARSPVKAASPVVSDSSR
jgi:hypothetical protein